MWTFIFKEMGTRLKQLEHEVKEKKEDMKNWIWLYLNMA